MKLEVFSDILPLNDSFLRKLEISGLACDSRLVVAGNLFFAIPGVQSDGSSYIDEAYHRGAVAAVVSNGAMIDENCSIPIFYVKDPRYILALCAARFSPAQPDIFVGVTGTSGKTSVASFLRQIWTFAGKNAGSIGTTGITPSGSFSSSSLLTTPNPIDIRRIFSSFMDLGVTHAVTEASSHGLEQFRLDGIHFSAGAFTNLGHEHLDYHKTMDSYIEAKLRLFEALLPPKAPAVIFADDLFSLQFIERAKIAGLDVLTVGRSGSFIQLKRVEHQQFRQRAEIVFDGRIYEIEVSLAADFQICNALLSAALAMTTGISPEETFQALKILKSEKGRLELVGSTPSGASIYVDYAHKPDALKTVLSALRPFTTGRLILVFGCGGNRDHLKRPIMGEIGSSLADICIVTDDNPRKEDPAMIRSSILFAAPGAIEIADRRSAIQTAINMLREGDTLIVAGKGHEEGQIVGDTMIPFSDHEEINTFLKAL